MNEHCFDWELKEKLFDEIINNKQHEFATSESVKDIRIDLTEKSDREFAVEDDFSVDTFIQQIIANAQMEGLSSDVIKRIIGAVGRSRINN